MSTQHSCGRTGSQCTVFMISSCIHCAVLLVSKGPNSGWDVTSLARAMAELRLHSRYLHGADPEPVDTARAHLAFSLVEQDVSVVPRVHKLRAVQTRLSDPPPPPPLRQIEQETFVQGWGPFVFTFGIVLVITIMAIVVYVSRLMGDG